MIRPFILRSRALLLPRPESKSLAQLKRFRLGFESLEHRRVLATVTVNTDVGAAGELRTAIAATPAGGTVDFALSAGNETITLALGQLVVNKNLTINGLNAGGSGVPVSISGNNLSRVFLVDDGNGLIKTSTVNFRSLTIRGGSADQGAGISNAETLNLERVTVTSNKALQPNAAFDTFGGGILNTGELTLRNSIVTSNVAQFAAGGVNNSFGAGIASTGVGSSLRVLENSLVSANETIGGTGGGIFTSQGSLRLESSTVSNNRAGLDINLFPGIQRYDYGAGIASFSEGAGGGIAAMDVTITSSEISGNVLTNSPFTDAVFPYGGGLFVRGQGTVTLTDTCVTSNTINGTESIDFSVYGRGGGMFLYGDDGGPLNVTIDKSTVSNNRAEIIGRGGGIAVRGRLTNNGDPLDDGTVNLTVRGSDISDNYAGSRGGGIFNWALGADAQGVANIRIQSSTITGNSTGPAAIAFGGGGVNNQRGGYMLIDGTTVEGNSGYYGGGLYNASLSLTAADPSPLSRMVVRNSTITGNFAEDDGGGLYSYDGNTEVHQSTISGNNSAVAGGGAFLFTTGFYIGTPNETRSVIDRSTITRNTSVSSGGGIATDYYSISNWSNSIISGNSGPVGFENVAFNGNTTVTQAFNYVDGNAQLDVLMDNGGPTLTHKPMAGSPVINAGDPAAAGVADQRGYTPRVSGGRMDVGAVEVGATATCDEDGDGDCDIADIDLVIMAIAAGMAPLSDRDAWLAAAGAENLVCGLPYTLGDFNLDGFTDGTDFNIFNSNKFTQTGKWSKGDASGDGFTDGSDFNIFNANKFTSACGVNDCTAPAQRKAAHSLSANSDKEARKSGARRRNESSAHEGRQGQQVGLTMRLANEGGAGTGRRAAAIALHDARTGTAKAIPIATLKEVATPVVSAATASARPTRGENQHVLATPAKTETLGSVTGVADRRARQVYTVFDSIFADLGSDERHDRL